jgi:hypothetical protein
MSALSRIQLDCISDQPRYIEFLQGAPTDLSHESAVEYLCLISQAGDYTATEGSIFALLQTRGVVVSDLAIKPAYRLPKPYEGWVSEPLPSSARLPFSRVLMLDIPAPLSTQAPLQADRLLRALQLVCGQRATTVAICTDYQALTGDISGYFSWVRMLFYAATHYGSLSRWSVSRICLFLSPGLSGEQINLLLRKFEFDYDNPLAGVAGTEGDTPWKDALDLIRWDSAKYKDETLTERQRVMVFWWTTNAYAKVQRALRLNDVNAPEFVQYQSCITGISTALDNLLDLDSPVPVLRTQNITDASLNDYRSRAEMFHQAFTSTCLDTLFAPQESIACLRIQSRTGKVIIHLSEYPEEREVLFDAGMTDRATEDILSPGEITYLNTATGQEQSTRFEYILTSEQIEKFPVTQSGGT